MEDSTRKRPLPNDNLSPHTLPTPLNKMPRTDSAITSLSQPLSPSPFERLLPALVQLIAQFLPPRARMAHLPLLSHSFPPITSAAFREDHITLTEPLMRLICASDRVRDLMSAVPALSFDGRTDDGTRDSRHCMYPFLNPSPSCSPGLHPPFFSGLEECNIHLYFGDRCLPNDPILSPLDRRHLTIDRLVQALASCPLLSTLSLVAEPEDGEQEADDSSIIDQLQTFPSLHTLILGELRCDQQSMSLLFSLPLVHLDIHRLFLHPSQRTTLYPCSLTLRSLRMSWLECFMPLVHPYTQLTEEEGSGLRFFGTDGGDEDWDPERLAASADDLSAFLRSCPSLTAFSLLRDVEWDLGSLLVDPSLTMPTSQGLHLPRLQHLAYKERHVRPDDRLTVPQCLRWYGPQLLTLYLQLSRSHSLGEVLTCCMEQCRQLRTLKLRAYRRKRKDDDEEQDEEDERRDDVDVIAKLPSVYPPLPSLHYLKLEATDVTSEDDLLAILTACPNLHHLKLDCTPFLTLGFLPLLGAACRHLVSVRLFDISSNPFPSTTLAMQDLDGDCSPSSPSTAIVILTDHDRCLFPHLTHLHVIFPDVDDNNTDDHVVDPSVLSSLISLLTPSPLTTLRIHGNVHIKPQHYAIFAPLQHLVELDVDGLPSGQYQCRVRRSRREAQRWTTRELFDQEWRVENVDHDLFVDVWAFEPDRRWSCLDEEGQEWLVAGREAFFASLSFIKEEDDGDRLDEDGSSEEDDEDSGEAESSEGDDDESSECSEGVDSDEEGEEDVHHCPGCSCEH
jgi:hypothetical protein